MKTITKLLCALCVMLCSSVATASENEIIIEGSSTVGPIAKAFAEYYMRNNKGVNITVNESGSGNGAKALVEGKCDIATMSRFMKNKEYKAATAKDKTPTAHVVAMDGIAIVVNPANPVKNLSVNQIRDIYMKKISNWKDLGGTDTPIIIISRDTSSGTYETFNKLVMEKKRISDSAEYVGSNGQMRARVQSTKGAIGYLGLGFVDKTVKALTVNNIPVTSRSIASGLYPIARALFMFTDGYPKPGSHACNFINIYLTPEGQEIITRIGFIPLTTYKK